MPPKRTTPKGYQRARKLRRNQTPAEQKLWRYLRSHQLKSAGFRRQHAIGPFIVDFCAPRWKIIIELDGGHHADQVEYDSMRTVFLERQDYRVLRFWNNEVMNNIQGVVQVISETLPTPFYDDQSTPPFPPQIRKCDLP